MNVFQWGQSNDGLYEVVSLSEKTLNMGMDVMRNAFFMDETVSRACELHRNPAAIQELDDLSLRAAQDGISLIALEKSTGKAAGIALNIYQIKENSEKDDAFYDNLKNKCRHPGSKQLLQFTQDIAHEFDVFGHFNVDSFIEIIFAAVLQEHRGHGLGKLLFKCSIELGRKLSRGESVRTSIGHDASVSLKTQPPVPKLIAAYCSSNITQKITKDLGFQNVHNIDFNLWEFEGKNLAEIIGPAVKHTSVDCLVL